jgi:hypothetical protein
MIMPLPLSPHPRRTNDKQDDKITFGKKYNFQFTNYHMRIFAEDVEVERDDILKPTIWNKVFGQKVVLLIS